MSDAAAVLVIQSKRVSAPSFAAGLAERGYGVTTVSSVPAALSAHHTAPADVIVLDAAALQTSGERMIRALRRKLPAARLLMIVSEGQLVADSIHEDANLVLQHPFTIRKLVNGIGALLPVAGGQWLELGELRLNIDERRVVYGGNEATLTPKKTRLLQVLIENAGETISRNDLIREVWDTEYVGDTRTLDVHISWLRKTLRNHRSNQSIIKTVRGQGYMLDLPARKPPTG